MRWGLKFNDKTILAPPPSWLFCSSYASWCYIFAAIPPPFCFEHFGAFKWIFWCLYKFHFIAEKSLKLYNFKIFTSGKIFHIPNFCLMWVFWCLKKWTIDWIFNVSAILLFLFLFISKKINFQEEYSVSRLPGAKHLHFQADSAQISRFLEGFTKVQRIFSS